MAKTFPNIWCKAEFSKSAVTKRIYSGLIYVSFCASFNTNAIIDKVSANAYKYEKENNNISNVVTINEHAILEKYLSKRDRIVFCHRKNWWVGSES